MKLTCFSVTAFRYLFVIGLNVFACLFVTFEPEKCSKRQNGAVIFTIRFADCEEIKGKQKWVSFYFANAVEHTRRFYLHIGLLLVWGHHVVKSRMQSLCHIDLSHLCLGTLYHPSGTMRDPLPAPKRPETLSKVPIGLHPNPYTMKSVGILSIDGAIRRFSRVCHMCQQE